MQFHLETEAEELIARGVAPDEARRRALEQFGDPARTVEQCSQLAADRMRRARWGRFVDSARQEARYALRGFGQHPAFTAAVVATLALGVGANAAVLSIVDRIFLRPPEAVPAADNLRRLYAIRNSKTRGAVFRARYSLPEARSVAAKLATAFPTTIYLISRQTKVQLSSSVERTVVSSWVMPNFLRTVGVRVATGRDFIDEDLQFGHPASAAVVSWAFWQRDLGGALDVIGKTIRVGDAPIRIVGVGPRGFTGIDVDAVSIWLPLNGFIATPAGEYGPWYEQRGLSAWQLVSRIPDGSASAQLDVRLREALRADAREYRRTNGASEQFGDTLAQGRAASIIAARGPLAISHEMSIALALAGVAALILVIASANVGNLLLGRALQRRREIAVRIALGISRRRLAGRILLESTLLAMVAAAAATLAAVWIGAALRRLLFPAIVWATGAVDRRITLLAAVLGIFSGLIAGLVPMMDMMRVDSGAALKAGAREGGGRRSRIRATLVGVQAALSLVLLVGTGLFARTLHNIRDIDLGYDVDRVIIVSARDSAGWRRVPQLKQLALSLPGVERAALSGMAPLDGRYGAWPGRLFGRNGDSVNALGNEGAYMLVEPSYLATVGTRILRGRDLSANDRRGAPPVMVVSEEMARRVWPDSNAIGKCLRVLRRASPCYTVVGVAANAHGFSVVEDPSTVFYMTLDQKPNEDDGGEPGVEGMVVRVSANPRPIIERLRAELGEGSSGMRSVSLMADELAPQYRPWQMGARLFGSFGALALLLAGLGMYSVLAYAVTLRRHELGVRLALGATGGRLMRQVIGDSVRQVSVGILAGGALVVVGSRYVTSLLYEVSPRDPLVIGAAAGALILCAAAAALLPARRASRVDPMVALQEP
jgi:predicted permease